MALLTAVACGGDDDPSGPPGSITLSASPQTLTVQQGGTGTVTVTLVRGGGFADPVTVSVSGLPAGVTLAVSPSPLTGNTTTATVTVTVANTVPAGSYTATVTGTATGIGSHTAQYTLVVTAAPNYALTATPANVSIGQGGTGTTTIGIQRTSFTGAVDLTLVNPPAGVTGSFNPASSTTDQSVLTINVASTVATGNYTLTVRGGATGPGEKTTTVALTVTPPPDYSLSTTPATLSIAAGQTGQTTVNITRTNFTGAVTLSLDAPPAGVTATFNPAAPTGNTSTATISVAANVAPGDYQVTIKGTATGVPTFRVNGAVDEAAAAGDRTTTVTVTVTPAPALTISASPSAINTTPGGNAASTVTIVRTNLTGDVALTLTNPPPGITGTFAPATLTGATLSSTLTVNVASNVAPGNYNVTVQGAGGGLTSTTVVAVTVAAGPSVTLSITPTSLNIEQGSSGQATLNAARSNFTGDITPSVTGAPAGMTVAFNPTPLTANTSTVTVTVGASVTVGAHTLTITGATGGAAGTPTTTLTVNVTAPTGGSNIVWEFCNTDDLPLKFWRLSGGTWSEVTPTTVGNVTRFSFNISSTQGGIAFTVSNTGGAFRTAALRQRPTVRHFIKRTRDASQAAHMRLANQTSALTVPYFDTFVLLGLATELGGFVETCGTTTGTPVSKTFQVNNQIGSEAGLLGYGSASASLTSATTTYNLMVQPGSYDWMAAFSPAPGLPDFTYNWSAYRIGRNEAAPGGTVTVDRNGATPFVTVPLTITGGAGGSFYQTSQFIEGSRGGMLGFPVGSLFNSTGTGTLYFLAPGDRLSTDMVSATVLNLAESGGFADTRASINYFGSAPPASGDIALPASVPPYTVAPVNGTPVSTWSTSGSIPADYQDATSFVIASYEGAGGSALVTVTATRGWLTANNMSTNYTLTMPVLPNFLPQWAPASPLASHSVSMFGSNLTTAPTAGTSIRFAIRMPTP